MDFEDEFQDDLGTQIIDDIYLPPPPVQPNLTGNQTGDRLIIENIEITNFKSYGGRTVLGPFHKSFNSIVGPNGSGKSNVIDSMLFVFGYRASKIRSAKIANLIHKSDTLPDCTEAKVKVNFAVLHDKGGHDHDINPDSRFSISRIVQIDNTSYYMIDNSRVSFAAVSKKLEEFAIDLRYNRFLILQGEVEQISLMKPKGEHEGETGMLEFLEDIIGTSRYKLPIDQLNEKYRELNEERIMYVNRVNRCGKELKTISAAKDEAVKALELQNRIAIERSKTFQLRLYEESRKLAKDEDAFAQEQEKMNQLNAALEEAEAKKAAIDEDEKHKSEQFKAIKAERERLKGQFEECSKKDYYLDQTRKKLKEKLKKAKKQIAEEEAKLEPLQRAVEESADNTEVEELEKERTELQEELVTNEEQMKTETQAAQQDCAELIEQRTAVDTALMQFKNEQTDKLNAMNEAYNEWTVLKEQSDSAKAKVDQNRAKLQKVTEETEEKRRRIARFEDELPKDEQAFADKSTELMNLEQQWNALSEEMTTKQQELNILRNDAESRQSRDRTWNALEAAMRDGTLQGIYGRLGSLGAIDKKYDIAITTVCGRLSNIVVDTMENSVAAIRFLKANTLPPVTFIALDKLQPWTKRWNNNRSYPEDVPRLFDLVRVNDETFLPAFYFALGETLVADDLAQANRIGYGSPRYKVVSLQGVIVDTDGSMSGGGRPRSGGMGSTVARTSITDHSRMQRLEEDLATLTERRQQVHYSMESTRRDVIQLERDLKLMRENYAQYQQELQHTAPRLEQLQRNVDNAEAEMARFADNPEIELAEKRYLERKKIYDKEEEKMTAEQAKLAAFDAEIKEKLNARLEPIKKRKKAVEKKLKELANRINTIASERKSAELQLQKVQQTLATSQQALVTFEEELEKNKTESKELEAHAKEVTDQYEAIGRQCEEFAASFGTMQEEVKRLENEVKHIKSEQMDLKHELDKKHKVLKEKRAAKVKWQRELDALELHDVDLEEEEESQQTQSQEENDDEDEGDEDEEDQDDQQQQPKTTSHMDVDGEALANGDEPMEVDQAGETPVNGEASNSSQVEVVPIEPNAKAKKRSKKRKPARAEIPVLTAEELAQVDEAVVKKTVDRLTRELNQLKPNYAAIDDFKAKRADYRKKFRELETVTERRDTYMDHIKSTKSLRLKQFKAGFYAISHKLKELYRTITLGGDADLEFIDSLDPFAEGVNFSVRPNKKSWKNNINLSGGEKTLASLALIFALHYYKPSPLYIMDEIDAALDFKNVSIIANYIKQRTRNTQFLIISLRSNMYELAEMLIGVYKTKNVSKTIALDPIAFEAKLKGATGTQSSQADTQGSKRTGWTSQALSSQQQSTQYSSQPPRSQYSTQPQVQHSQQQRAQNLPQPQVPNSPQPQVRDSLQPHNSPLPQNSPQPQAQNSPQPPVQNSIHQQRIIGSSDSEMSDYHYLDYT